VNATGIIPILFSGEEAPVLEPPRASPASRRGGITALPVAAIRGHSHALLAERAESAA